VLIHSDRAKFFLVPKCSMEQSYITSFFLQLAATKQSPVASLPFQADGTPLKGQPEQSFQRQGDILAALYTLVYSSSNRWRDILCQQRQNIRLTFALLVI